MGFVWKIIITVLSAGAIMGAQPVAATAAEKSMSVFVSILPQAYFVERIADGKARVSVLVGPGQSPHTYEPTPQQMARLSDADIYFSIGLPFEKRLLQKITGIARSLVVVDTGRGIALRTTEGHKDNDHAQSMLDPHIWLAPLLIKIQAATISEALCSHDPANAGVYRDNLKAFQSELDVLDAEIREKIKPFAGREIFVFHPAFGYYTDAYGLRQIAIETQGKEPGSRSLAAVVDRAKNRGVKVIFAERQFSPKTAAAVARQAGAEVITLDPLGRDCFENLRSITDRIIYALSK